MRRAGEERVIVNSGRASRSVIAAIERFERDPTKTFGFEQDEIVEAILTRDRYRTKFQRSDRCHLFAGAKTMTRDNEYFIDRRKNETDNSAPLIERRQFANSHDELSPPARELGVAIDRYKLTNRRRFITYEEMLHVIKSLGYSKTEQAAEAQDIEHAGA